MKSYEGSPVFTKKNELRKQFFREFKKFQNQMTTSQAVKIIEDFRNNFSAALKRGNPVDKGPVLIYKPLPSEIPIDRIFETLPVEIAYPEIDGRRLRIVDSSGKPIQPRRIRLVVTPGLYVSREGIRLGRGGGYYDRFLAEHSDLPTVFAGYSWQIRDDLPTDEWDVPVQMIVTPEDSFEVQTRP